MTPPKKHCSSCPIVIKFSENEASGTVSKCCKFGVTWPHQTVQNYVWIFEKVARKVVFFRMLFIIFLVWAAQWLIWGRFTGGFSIILFNRREKCPGSWWPTSSSFDRLRRYRKKSSRKSSSFWMTKTSITFVATSNVRIKHFSCKFFVFSSFSGSQRRLDRFFRRLTLSANAGTLYECRGLKKNGTFAPSYGETASFVRAGWFFTHFAKVQHKSPIRAMTLPPTTHNDDFSVGLWSSSNFKYDSVCRIVWLDITNDSTGLGELMPLRQRSIFQP